MDTILNVKGLSKKYNDFHLRHINFQLKRGSITGFIGENGAGKSTTIQSILNIIDYDSGEILFNGETFLKNRNDLKKRIGYMGDNNKFYDDVKLKVIRNFVKNAYIEYWDDKFSEYLVKDVFNLNLDMKMKELSKGMRAKFLLTLAMSHNPDLLILDEPTSGLDPIVRNQLLEILNDIAEKKGTTIFFSSHITDDIEKIAQKIIYLDNGSILLNEEKEVIFNRFKKIPIDKINSIQIEKLKELGVLVQDYIVVDKQALKGQNIYDFNLEKVVLDEVLLLLKKQKKN
ncbi:TPA: ABC transporter ATP-binding protein [Bacillus thuringiensis]|nr:ABC transporter ATP-binding protein [Bacillus cereus]HDR4798190.1 ABC transporter ATP-binding protein [Bacillus cereus]HDR4804278.1 ABC transporter ATP-binding protein [Bacillus cereus]HDR4810286.1 ABC transporter ATP-binding protein [Bacillus cereus]HDR4833630.1 ABC transporter ATP-binding protein [Bacillus cereus]